MRVLYCLLQPVLYRFSSWDAAPLRVQAPCFFMTDIGQSTQYPGRMNSLMVTLLSNVDMQNGSSIMISNLGWTLTKSGNIDIIGDGALSFQLLGSGSGLMGKSQWDAEAKTLTLVVASRIPAGTQVNFSFQLTNPYCAQTSPPVCI